jgi:putative NADH-flavin reductase
MNNIQTIAVIGGSGKAGQYIINELIARGFKIKALVRNPEKLPVENQLVTKIIGDVRMEADLLNLFDGCDAIISALGQSKKEKPVFSSATTNSIKAMNRLKIKRYIVITGLTINTPFDKKDFNTKLLSWIMRISFPAIIKDKQKEYSLLMQSDLNWSLFRLPMIELSSSIGDVKVNLTNSPGKKISATDLARFLVDQLNSYDYLKQAPFLSN